MALQRTAQRRPLRLRLILGASVVLVFCGSNALARDFEFPAAEQCDGMSYSGYKPQAPWSVEVVFRYSGGKLSAIRYLHSHPGEDIYVGAVGPDGSVKISSDGSQDDGNRWSTYFQGKIALTGATVVSGELRVPNNGHRMACSIVFQIPAEQLRAQIGPSIARPSSPPALSPMKPPALSVATPAAPILVVNNPAQAPSMNVVITNENAAVVNTRIADLKSQIDVLTTVLSEQLELKKATADELRPSFDKAIEAVNVQVERLKKEHSTLDKSFGVYLTSIKPNDRDLYLTARKASEIYPKIPYYIPGTNETGEFWVEPSVLDSGALQFGFKFVDTTASVERVRETIEMSLPEIEDAQKALFKLHAWSEIAHQQKLRRNYEKRVTCFPISECPPDGERIDGKASTEIRFEVYEDGSTAGRIQRNKGLFVEGYNVSIDSAMLLQAYLFHVIKEARIEFKSGTQDKKALDDLFR